MLQALPLRISIKALQLVVEMAQAIVEQDGLPSLTEAAVRQALQTCGQASGEAVPRDLRLGGVDCADRTLAFSFSEPQSSPGERFCPRACQVPQGEAIIGFS